MSTRSRIAYGVRVLAGGLPDEPLVHGGLPEHVIYEVIVDCETSMLIDLNLSDQNRRVQSKTITLNPNTYDFNVNSTNLSVPAFAQLRVNPTDTWQEPIDIVNFSSIDQAGIDGRMAVAFYGNPLRARLSWVPQTNEQHALTLWFDRSVDIDGPLADEPDLEDAYTVHLKLQAVAQCMEIMGKPVGDVLKARIMKGESQWEKYTKRNGQQGVVTKTSSHPRARSGGRTMFQRTGGGIL